MISVQFPRLCISYLIHQVLFWRAAVVLTGLPDGYFARLGPKPAREPRAHRGGGEEPLRKCVVSALILPFSRAFFLRFCLWTRPEVRPRS